MLQNWLSSLKNTPKIIFMAHIGATVVAMTWEVKNINVYFYKLIWH